MEAPESHLEEKLAEPDLIDALARFRAQLPERARLYVGGCSGEPGAAFEAFRAVPELAAGLTFLGVWIPGVNALDWTGLNPQARAESIFLSPALRASFETGRIALRPLSYTQAWPWLESTPLDGAIVMTTPPDGQDQLSLGVSADFAGAVLDRADVPALALINPHMPRPTASLSWPAQRFCETVEAPRGLPQIADKPLPPAFDRIAGHIAERIENGDTLQFGLGNVQQAILGALHDHRGLAVHSGMVSDPLLSLLDTGAVEAVTTGVAIGTDRLYARAASDDRFRFRPVRDTHSLATLAAIPRFKAINSVIEVDLFGQANAEFIGARQVSGTGGLVDFLRGAALSPGGAAITALTSTARRGAVSRIVPRLAPNATSIARADVGLVVTEQGVADLRGKTIDARAEALIEIADPAFRGELQAAWQEIRSAL